MPKIRTFCVRDNPKDYLRPFLVNFVLNKFYKIKLGSLSRKPTYIFTIPLETLKTTHETYTCI